MHTSVSGTRCVSINYRFFLLGHEVIRCPAGSYVLLFIKQTYEGIICRLTGGRPFFQRFVLGLGFSNDKRDPTLIIPLFLLCCLKLPPSCTYTLAVGTKYSDAHLVFFFGGEVLLFCMNRIHQSTSTTGKSGKASSQSNILRPSFGARPGHHAASLLSIPCLSS
ncbi:hypothetical protein B0F90DRAFT_348033 [Multifurca ochricompacta]|uniref:Uncharacterized protein n=1 Tax=Multifurca ochricompacta TaxID=376703 RepID=A0AAD4QL19_9AGAM|nr:hypothetical protein B0F90DRAFT_348033 [Multifurca ochricompacta]